MLDLSFGTDTEPAAPAVDPERLNKLIGVLQGKSTAGEPQYLIAATFDELVELVEFLEENALESETVIRTLQKRFAAKVALIEKRG